MSAEQKIGAGEMAGLLAGRSEGVCRHLLPNGIRYSREWVCGSIAGEPGESLKVNLTGLYSGKWCDWATDQRGDLLDLWQKIRAVGLGEAIAQATEFLRIGPGELAAEKVLEPRCHQRSDLPFIWDNCVADFKVHVEEIAVERGFIPTFLEAHRLTGAVGWHRGGVAFPVHDECGVIIGCHYRTDDGWRYTPGCKASPLVIGNADTAGNIIFFESQWDALAFAATAGYEAADCRAALVVTRGAANGGMASQFARDGVSLFIVPQNDPPNLHGGKVASEEWAKAVLHAVGGRQVRRIEVPKEHKDLNEWTHAGVGRDEILGAFVRASEPAMIGVQTFSIEELLAYTPSTDENCLLGDRWIGRGGSALWIGQSGIGKSTLAVQAAVSWAAGLDFVGVRPAQRGSDKSARSLFIQAENDEGDMAEMVQGAVKGLREKCPEIAHELPRIIGDKVVFVRDTVHTAEEFVAMVKRLVVRYKPDLVWLDPLLAFLGDDINSQRAVSHFLRNLLNPLAMTHGFAWMIVHHTGKPSSDSKSRSEWNHDDFSYYGLGSSELTNWARSIMVLRATTEGKTYRLMFTKRGGRAGAQDLEGARTKDIYLQQASYPEMFWKQVEEPEVPVKKNSQGNRFKQKYLAVDVLELMPESRAISTVRLKQRCDTTLGMSKATFHRLFKELKESGRIRECEEGWIKC